MRIPRIHVDYELRPGHEVLLPDQAGEHVARVLRLERGAARIVPIVTERTEVKLDAERAERRMAHWRGVIASACEQCGRTHLPELDAPQAMDRWLATLVSAPALRLALLPEGDASLRQFPQMEN